MPCSAVPISRAVIGSTFPGMLQITFLCTCRSSPPRCSKPARGRASRSEEHTSELQSLMRISYAVFCLKKKKTNNTKLKNSHRYIHNTPDDTSTIVPNDKHTLQQ